MSLPNNISKQQQQQQQQIMSNRRHSMSSQPNRSDMEKSAALMQQRGGKNSNIMNATGSTSLWDDSSSATALLSASTLQAVDRSLEVYFQNAQHNTHKKRRSRKRKSGSLNNHRHTEDSSSEDDEDWAGKKLSSSTSKMGTKANNNGDLMDAKPASKNHRSTNRSSSSSHHPKKHRSSDPEHQYRMLRAVASRNNAHAIGPSARSDSSFSAADGPPQSSSSSSEEDAVLRCDDSITEMENPRYNQWAGLLKKRPRDGNDKEELKEWLKELLVVSQQHKDEPLKVTTGDSSSSSTNYAWESSTGSDRGDETRSNESSSASVSGLDHEEAPAGAPEEEGGGDTKLKGSTSAETDRELYSTEAD